MLDAPNLPDLTHSLLVQEPEGQEPLPIRFLSQVLSVDGLTNCDFLLLEGEEIVASCRVENWNLPGGWLSWVHVPESHRRRGFATILVDHVLQATQAAGKQGLALTVQTANMPAQLLYYSLGFRAVGTPFYDLANVLMTHHFAPAWQKGARDNA